jgi:hypothetical protein
LIPPTGKRYRCITTTLVTTGGYREILCYWYRPKGPPGADYFGLNRGKYRKGTGKMANFMGKFFESEERKRRRRRAPREQLPPVRYGETHTDLALVDKIAERGGDRRGLMRFLRAGGRRMRYLVRNNGPHEIRFFNGYGYEQRLLPGKARIIDGAPIAAQNVDAPDSETEVRYYAQPVY